MAKNAAPPDDAAQKRSTSTQAKTEAVLKIARSLSLDTIPSASLAEYEDLFDRIDEDQSGFVEPHELKQQFIKVGLDIDGENFGALIDGLDQDNSGGVDLEEFVTVLHAFILQQRDVGDLDTYVNFGVEEIAPEFHGSPWSKFQHKVWIALEQPSSSVAAMCISVAIMSLIFASTLSFVLETDPSLRTPEHQSGFAVVETVSVAAFTLEYLLRLFFCPNKRDFLTSVMNTVDLVAVLPFYIERMMASSDLKGSQVLRVIRLVRVFRLMKISRYLTWLKVFKNTLVVSIAPLGMILFITCIATVVSASAIYYAERDTPIESLPEGMIPFDSIPRAFWWAVVTMTTVGYGDMVPQSAIGQLFAVATAFSGILILAIPISVIAANFHNEYQLTATTKELSLKLGRTDEELDKEQRDNPELTHWSQGYLRSSLDLIMTNRQRITTGMKSIEAANRVDFNAGFAQIADLVCETADRAAGAVDASAADAPGRRSALGSMRSLGSTAVSRAVSAARRSVRRMSNTGISTLRSGKNATSFDLAAESMPNAGLWQHGSGDSDGGHMSSRASATVHTDYTVARHLRDMKG